MTERTTPSLTKPEAFKIADALARLLIGGDDYGVSNYEPWERHPTKPTIEDLRESIYSHLLERFHPVKEPQP